MVKTDFCSFISSTTLSPLQNFLNRLVFFTLIYSWFAPSLEENNGTDDQNKYDDSTNNRNHYDDNDCLCVKTGVI